MANINEFKNVLLNGGARANQFRVYLQFPAWVTGGIEAAREGQFLCKAAALPQSNIANIPVNYRGREVNFAGERTYEAWTITAYTDTNFILRDNMEVWQNGIQNYTATTGRTAPADYQVQLRVDQLDRGGAILKSYTFIDAYPINIGEIALDYESGNAIETFSVTFQYNYFESNTTSASSGFGLNVSINTPIGSIPL